VQYKGEALINLSCKYSLQDSFLFYFNLKSHNSEYVPRAISPLKKSSCKRRYPMGVRFSRCTTVPFSSPLGILIQKKSRMAPINSQVSPLLTVLLFYYCVLLCIPVIAKPTVYLHIELCYMLASDLSLFPSIRFWIYRVHNIS
jgi:hypothetical protein